MKLKELAKLSPNEKRSAVAKLVSASLGPPNGQMGALNAKLGGFEAQYSMSTAQMLEAFRAGSLEDSEDIAEWLVFARAGGG